MGRILIVEDEADLVAIYRIALEQAGHVVVRVITEASGLEGDLSETFRGIDVAILDERLGQISGTSYLRAIRIANPALRIIVASADPEALQRAHEMGADEVRKKPFSLRQLRDDVARLMSARSLSGGDS